MSSRTARTRLALAAILALVMGCGDAQAPGSDNPPRAAAVLASLIVSNPTASPGAAATSSGASGDAGIVYTSLPPGSVPDGERAVITTRRTGAQVTVAMIDGGFDPAPLEATAGDTLDIRIEPTENSAALRFIAVVPARRPPIVVRTDPPPKKQDVPLNAVLLVVFSEPLDPATLADESLQLLLDGAAVGGTLGFGDNTHLTVTFTPAAPLEPDADYTLQLTQAIADLDGDPLEAAVSVTFTTEGVMRGKIVFVKSTLDHAADPFMDEIYMMDADGSNPVNLTKHSAGDYSPAVSPDGTRIAFSTRRDGNLEIYMMNAHGSNPANLTKHPAEDVGAPAWSPDGKKIAFSRGGQIGGQIYVMNADGSNPVNLTNEPGFDDFTPAWSPDGTKIAFSRSGQIYVMNADGSNPVNLTNHQGYDFAPTWSPDGTKIAFTKSVESVYEIFVMNADGSDPVNLTNNPDSYDWWPAWSPDGTRIAFASRRDGNDEVYVMNADGSNPVNLTNDPDWQDWLPAWSPE